MCGDGGWCPVRQRFQAKTRTVPGIACTWFTGGIGSDGYGRFHAGPTRADGTVTAHRWSYEHLHGPLEPGLMTLHLCDETLCVEPTYLQASTHTVNMAHMRSRGRQGGPWHSGRTDTRGPSGRARAIRDAVNAGADAELLRTVMRAGEPWRATGSPSRSRSPIRLTSTPPPPSPASDAPCVGADRRSS